MQDETDFADGSVDAVIDVHEDVLAPKLLGDLLARNQLARALEQQDKQLHRELFEAQDAVAALKPKTRDVEREVGELELLGRKYPGGLEW
jgi:hypothetical protein